MILIEETEIPLAALPVSQFKAHLRLGTGFADDDVQDGILEGFLRASLAAIEARTGKALLAREFSWELTAWRDPSGQALPIAPVTALVQLSLHDGGVSEIIDAQHYHLVRDTQRPVLKPTDTLLPAIAVNGVAEVRFVAGYGVTWGDLPADLAQAVLLLGAHYYEYRNEVNLGDGCMPFGVTSLIERYRTVRILGGGHI